jgi:carbamoylphosphate synthase large subunit
LDTVLSEQGRICATIEEAQALTKETGFPIIAKPDFGVGAEGGPLFSPILVAYLHS